MNTVGIHELQPGLLDLRLSGQDVAVHASLRSFGFVAGGEQTVITALRQTCATILMPSFCEIGRTNPPEDDRPLQNGWAYGSYRIDDAGRSRFDPATFGPGSGLDDREMGRIASAWLATPGSVRSRHPSVSWAAGGPRAEWFADDHAADDPNLPLKRLLLVQGQVLLLGVGLSACTALHLAEEQAGRRPFIRWIRYADGRVRRVREYGCSDGFPNLAPWLEPLGRHTTIGRCRAVAYPIAALVKTAAALMRQRPDLTLCTRQGPCRCQDAVRGGPILAESGSVPPSAG